MSVHRGKSLNSCAYLWPCRLRHNGKPSDPRFYCTGDQKGSFLHMPLQTRRNRPHTLNVFGSCLIAEREARMSAPSAGDTNERPLHGTRAHTSPHVHTKPRVRVSLGSPRSVQGLCFVSQACCRYHGPP